MARLGALVAPFVPLLVIHHFLFVEQIGLTHPKLTKKNINFTELYLPAVAFAPIWFGLFNCWPLGITFTRDARLQVT